MEKFTAHAVLLQVTKKKTKKKTKKSSAPAFSMKQKLKKMENVCANYLLNDF